MAQHDMIIANDTGANVRSDLNNALAAIASNNSGATEPSTTYAFQWWYDTTNSVLKLRNSANSAWITLPFSTTASSTVDINGGTIDGTTIGGSTPSVGSFSTINAADGTEAAPSITSTNDTNTGIYFPAADRIALVQGGSEAMRIDSSGNVNVGKTSSDYTVVGTSNQAQGVLSATRDGNNPLVLNRLTDFGDLARFYKDDALVGAIKARANDVVIYSSTASHAGLNFGSTAVWPVDNTGESSDGACRLGTSSTRFSDLYLSGGVYLGGTGSANYLDDYEEGTWTPTYYPQSGSFTTLTMDVQDATYVKVGRLVYISCYIRTDEVVVGTASGQVGISGLPFTVSGNSRGQFPSMYKNLWGNKHPSGAYNNTYEDSITLTYQGTSDGGVGFVSVADLYTGANGNYNRIMLSGCYETDD